MKGLCFILLGVLQHGLGLIQREPECDKPNEVWQNCYSSSCKEARCMNGAFNEPGPMCTMDCRTGCVCKSGFARDSSGNCISEAACTGGSSPAPSSTCSSHDDCGTTSYCYSCSTCRKAFPFNFRQMCPPCRSGVEGGCGPLNRCALDKDSIDGVCPSFRPPVFRPTPPPTPDGVQCGPNQAYTDCGSACQGETCTSTGIKPAPSMACIMMCVQKCECFAGFIPHQDSSRGCVRKQTCLAEASQPPPSPTPPPSQPPSLPVEVPECPPPCPPGVPSVSCFVDPCQTAKCSNPAAICHADYCGGCNANWYLDGMKMREADCAEKKTKQKKKNKKKRRP